MKLSVVMPCLNAAATIGDQLEALSRQEWPADWEVVVADNGSTDGTAEVARRYADRLPDLRIVDASGRRGSAHARNVGAHAASGDAVVFCDADDEVGSGWLAAMGRALKKHDFIACRLDLNKLNPLEISGTVRNPQQEGLQRVEYPPYLRHASGSTLGVKREVHEAVGGFDESLFRLEDTDYWFSIQH
jgi:glycosyltransferase involved in cell wall biosynthesis